MNVVGQIAALAELRVRQGVAARLGWIVPLGAVVGFGAAMWAPGSDDAARAAVADRLVLGAMGGLAVLAALIPAATTMPRELTSGAAYRLLASPVSRFAVIAGGVLGHGLLASLLLVGGLGAAMLGLELGGLGTGEREPTRAFRVANSDEGGAVLRTSETATFQLVLPRGAIPAEELVLRLSPRAVNEGGELERTGTLPLALHQPGGYTQRIDVGFAPGRPFTARFSGLALDPALPVILTAHRPAGTWGLLLPPGSIEAGGPPEYFVRTAFVAALCLVPLLFLVAAAGGVGAARFNAPTALGLGLFLLLILVGQDVLRDGADYVVRAAETARAYEAEGHHEGDGHDHGDHDHTPAEVSPLQESLAKVTLAGLELLPPLDAFDRTSDLLDRRAVTPDQCLRASLLALPGLAVLMLASWLLLARRDLLPT